MTDKRIELIIEEVFQRYHDFGAEEYAGEKVSQLEHMCQAALFAMEEGYDDEVILAAFLHDIGHLLPVAENETMGSFGVTDHEKLGADYLMKLGFSKRLCSLIASHVNAKRYLCYSRPEYFELLSEASRKTLEFQGGRMHAMEVENFEADPLFPLYIKMRQWDEAAKVEQQPIPSIELFRIKAEQHLKLQAAQQDY